MKSKGQIDQCDYVAGRHWQAAYENAEIGGVRAIDPGKEAVDGGRLPEILTDQQRRAVVDLKNARSALGTEGNNLIHAALAHSLSMKQIAINRRMGVYSEAEHKYVGRRFRECLRTLAIRFGYSKMTADILQFIPRSTPKPVPIRTWPDPTPIECMAIDIVNQIFPSDETEWVAPPKDPA
jgi:hypothetical protein